MDGEEYMTPAEFAALPSAVHHAVWRLGKQVDFIPAVELAPNGTRRYNREQVQAIIRELEARRG